MWRRTFEMRARRGRHARVAALGADTMWSVRRFADSQLDDSQLDDSQLACGASHTGKPPEIARP